MFEWLYFLQVLWHFLADLAIIFGSLLAAVLFLVSRASDAPVRTTAASTRLHTAGVVAQ